MNTNVNSIKTQAQITATPVLRSKEEILPHTKMVYSMYRFYLYQKGYRRTSKSEITVSEVAEAKEKYNLSESISDFEFGNIEGKIFLSMMLEAFYDRHFDEGHIAWIQGLIDRYLDQIWCFIYKCAVNKPQIGTSPTYDFTGQLNSKLHAIATVAEHFRDEVNEWYCTPYEFGQLCGFVSAAHWAIGGEWEFNENDFDVPIDWKRFYSYLDKRSSKLKRRKIQEMSQVFQMFLLKPQKDMSRDNSSNGKPIPVKGIRRKLPDEPADTSTSLPDLPKPSSWLDW